MSAPDLTKLDTAIITVTLSPETVERAKKVFKTLHYYPKGGFPKEILKDVEIWLASWEAFPKVVEKVEDVPKLKVLQVTSAGVNRVAAHPVFQDPKAKQQIAVCSSSGIHAYSIPQHIIAQIVNLYMHHHIQYHLLRTRDKWASRAELVGAFGGKTKVEGGTNLGTKSLYGKTAGLLGYGHIGRESARLLKAFNVNVIAANSSGQKRADDGYIVPHTGDPDGSIPSAYYSSTDPASFKEFLGKCDILVASLPSTTATKYMLTLDHLKSLPDGAVFINVGRGDLVRSEDLLAALDAEGGLDGIAIDVTDPEPLTDGHPLFTHPRAIITPHTSGDFMGYFDAGAELFMANVEKMRKGGKMMNRVDLDKGY